MTTITIDRELLEQALAALTYQGTMWSTRRQRRMAAVDALRAALEAPSTAPEPENDCVLNHICNGRLVHLPDGEQCDRCGSVRP